MAPAVDALARSHRVVTFSLSDGRRAGQESGRCGIDIMVDQLEGVLDDRGLARATICGVSMGGRVALRFAARRPERTAALVLVSVPGPSWHLRPSHRLYSRLPWLFAPLFFAGMPGRLREEIAVAIPGRRDRLAFVRRQLLTALRAPVSPARLAAHARLIEGMNSEADCALVSAPTLIMSGEASLDHVVPAEGTCDFARLIAGARAMTLVQTGHLGCITRPTAFADALRQFLLEVGLIRSTEHAA
jgi:pimeloyl-ACP methyl ester carboxylesterase